MDLSDPETWKNGLRVLVSAPHVVVPLLIAVAFGTWWIRGQLQEGQISSLKAELSFADRQIAEYKQKLGGASPDEAKARIQQLEARVAKIEPRRLSQDQRSKLIAALRLAAGQSYRVIVGGEGVGDSMQYSNEFAGAFAAAGNWIVTSSQVFGVGVRPRSGIVLSIPNDVPMPPEAAIIASAMKAAEIQFDVQPQPWPKDKPIELLVTAVYQ
jgi:hypothetical protein